MAAQSGAYGAGTPPSLRQQASGGARFVAWLADSLIVGAAAFALALAAHAYQQIDVSTTGVNGFYIRGTQTTYVLSAVGYLLLSALSISYFAVQWRIVGATLGQRMLGIRVLDRASGRHLDWVHAMIRAAWFGGSSLFAIVNPALGGLVGVGALIGIAMGFGQYGQGLHDRTSGSVVVRLPRT